jgi:zinc protease
VRSCTPLLALAALVAAAPLVAAPPAWTIPTSVKTLANGLSVVVSEDHSTPTFGLSVAYHIGFRLEPKGRSGFAHLFEHMMFEGTPSAPKGTLDRVIESGGGLSNATTHLDFTSYTVSAPVSALAPVLWLEADRMRSLDLSAANLANQRDVVKEEIRVNVTNQPYGLFYLTDLSTLAFDKWENAHDGYGSFTDLDAATLGDVQAFHRTFYAPNNAVVAVAGDVEAAEVFALAERYFGSIPRQSVLDRPDVSEPRNTRPRTLAETDAFAKVPGVAVGWKAPLPAAPEFVPAVVLGELLVGGEASRLYQRLVKGRELLVDVEGGLGWPLGDALSIDGPSLLVVFGVCKADAEYATVVAAIQGEADRIAHEGVGRAELERTKTMMLSRFYSDMEDFEARAEALAVRTTFGGPAASLNAYPGAISAVTSAELKRVAAAYLTAANRSSIDRRPAAAAATDAEAQP